MNIAMLTNTYTPHVGGVARSVAQFAEAYRLMGHRVLVVAPEFPNTPSHETDIIRVPAVQNFNGSDFSVVFPVSGLLTDAMDSFQPHIVHSHHPYLLGMTGVRVARYREVPLVFTHHTRYEEYTHYVPGDSPVLKRFVIELATRYANLCDRVFAPSESIEALLRERGVVKPISVVPTGVEVERFAQGDGASFRAEVGIPRDAFVVGHLGRLAPEKNLAFLGNAVISFLRAQPAAHFLVVGEGPSETEIRALFSQAGLGNRLHVAGILQPARLVDAYHAMDVFAFASQSETQGMVLTEAMAAGVPVVALDAPGVREVVKDSSNGYLLHENTPEALDIALRRISSLSPALMGALKESARHTAKRFSIACTAQRALACYESLHWSVTPEYSEHFGQLERILHLIRAEWEILQGVVGAAGSALTGGSVQGINK